MKRSPATVLSIPVISNRFRRTGNRHWTAVFVVHRTDFTVGVTDDDNIAHFDGTVLNK